MSGFRQAGPAGLLAEGGGRGRDRRRAKTPGGAASERKPIRLEGSPEPGSFAGCLQPADIFGVDEPFELVNEIFVAPADQREGIPKRLAERLGEETSGRGPELPERPVEEIQRLEETEFALQLRGRREGIDAMGAEAKDQVDRLAEPGQLILASRRRRAHRIHEDAGETVLIGERLLHGLANRAFQGESFRGKRRRVVGRGMPEVGIVGVRVRSSWGLLHRLPFIGNRAVAVRFAVSFLGVNCAILALRQTCSGITFR